MFQKKVKSESTQQTPSHHYYGVGKIMGLGRQVCQLGVGVRVSRFLSAFTPF